MTLVRSLVLSDMTLLPARTQSRRHIHNPTRSYAREELDSGPRDSTIARSATNRSSHRGVSRGAREVVHEGRRLKTGVPTSHSRDTPPRGRNAAKTTSAMQVSG